MTVHTEATSTAKSAGLIGLAAVAGAGVGFFLQLLVAHYFGASANTDAYFMALSTSELLGKLLLGGSITAVFLPMFVSRLVQADRASAWTLALNLFHLSSATVAAVLLGLALFTEPFVKFIAPGFDEAGRALTVNLMRVMLPAFFFYFMSDLAIAILHSLKVFYIPALLRVMAPTVSILSIVALFPLLDIYSLAAGTTIGAALQWLFLVWGLGRSGFRYRFVFQPRNPDVKKILVLVSPFILSVLVTQAAAIVYRVLVSELPSGSLSALKYAEKITQLLTIIFLNSVTTVIYPLLSEKASRKDTAGMRETIASSTRLTTFLTVPIIIGVVFLREPLINLVYEHGSFTVEAAQLTSVALLFLVLGLTTNALSSILGHATLALQSSRAAVAVTIASHAVAIYLFVLLVPRLAHAGLALASSLVPLSSSLLYYLYLRRYIPRLGSIFIHTTYLKIAALAGLLVVTLLIVSRLLTLVSLPDTIAQLVTLVVATGLGSLVFFGTAHLWRIPESNVLSAILLRPLQKWRSGSETLL